MQFENYEENTQEKESQIFSIPSSLEDSDSFICSQQNKSLLDLPNSNEILDENDAAALISMSQVDNLQFDDGIFKIKQEEYQAVNEEEVMFYYK